MPLGMSMPTLQGGGLMGGIGGLGGASPQPQSPLINTAANYSYPLTSGLMGALNSQAPGNTNWTQVAMGLAGNPRTGPLPASPIPPVTPGSIPGSSGGSSFGSTMGGLLTALATNPGLAKGLTGSISNLTGLLGGGGAAAAADASAPALSAGDIAAGWAPSALGGPVGGLSDAAVTAGLNADADAGIAALPDFGAGGAGADTAAAAGADAGAGSGGLLAAMGPAALATAGFLGMDAIFNHNSSYNSEDTQTDLAQTAHNPNNPLAPAFQTMLNMYQSNPKQAAQQLFTAAGPKSPLKGYSL